MPTMMSRWAGAADGTTATAPSGYSFHTWSDPDDATADNNSTFAAVAPGNGQHSRYLLLTDFGFDIPSNHEIHGVELHYWVSRTGNGGNYDYDIRLLDDGSTVGSNRADTGELYPTTNPPASAFVRGADDDLWGASLTPGVMNAVGFGVGISVRRSGLQWTTARIHRVELRVWHDEPPEELIETSIAGTIQGGISETTIEKSAKPVTDVSGTIRGGISGTQTEAELSTEIAHTIQGGISESLVEASLSTEISGTIQGGITATRIFEVPHYPLRSDPLQARRHRGDVTTEPGLRGSLGVRRYRGEVE